MTTKRRPRQRPHLFRIARVLSWDLEMWQGTMHTKLGDFERLDRRVITLSAELLEPIKGYTKLALSVLSDSPDLFNRRMNQRIPDVARISAIRHSIIEATAFFNEGEISTLLMLVCADRLRSLSISCDEPRYGQAGISSLHLHTVEAERIA